MATLENSSIRQPVGPSQESLYSAVSQQSGASELKPLSPPGFSVLPMEAVVTEDVKPKELATSSTQEKIAVTLLDNELWSEFSQAQNEMIITKVGRNLFPVIKIKVERLNPDEIYKVELDICSVDDCRYKYHENEWVVAANAEPLAPSASYLHPDTPTKGSEIMKQPLSFRKVKITNSNEQKEGFITLNSMHKYVPRVTISIKHMGTFQAVESVTFKETIFYAVTAYQNQRVTQLKIKYNPFAKGFRGSDLSNSPRSSFLYSRFSHFNRGGLNYNPLNPTLSPPPIQASHFVPSQTPTSYMQLMPETHGPETQNYYYTSELQQPYSIPVTIRGTYTYGTTLSQPSTTHWSTSSLTTPQIPSYTNPSSESTNRGYESPQNLQSGISNVLSSSTVMPAVIAQQSSLQTQPFQVIQQSQTQRFPISTHQPADLANPNTQAQPYTTSTHTIATTHGQAY